MIRSIISILITCSFLMNCSFLNQEDLCTISFPTLPDLWRSLLGEPCWRLEWRGSSSEFYLLETDRDTQNLKLPWFPGTGSYILAYPFWPDQALAPGLFRPAGAIYPMDSKEGRLSLSWIGGVAAWLYREMDRSEGESRTAPEYFDWSRFYELLAGTGVPCEISDDPWRVDWLSAARRIRASGFNKGYLRCIPGVVRTIPKPASGPWFAVTPFPGGSVLEEGEWLSLYTQIDGSTYFCPQGFLCCTLEKEIFFHR